MRLLLSASLVACFIFCVPRAIASDATWPWIFKGIDYAVQTAPHVDVKLVKGADFDVYQFSTSGHIFLNAYVGNNPNFPSYATNKVSSKNRDRINGLQADTIIYQDVAGTRSRETLVTLKKEPHHWADFIHFFYSGDSKTDSIAADAIISSLEYLGIDQNLTTPPSPAPSAALRSTEQRVTVLAYGCDFTNTKTVSVAADNSAIFGQGPGRRVQVPAIVKPENALQFEFTLPPGPFTVEYSVDDQKCSSGPYGMAILSGHDRHMLVSMLHGEFVTDWHGRKFFAGIIPAVGVAVSVVASNSTGCPTERWPEFAATIDDGAYYVGHAYGAHAFLKLRSSAFDVLYIALPDASPDSGNDEYVIRNITSDDIRGLTSNGWNPGVPCIKSPSGSSTRFDM